MLEADDSERACVPAKLQLADFCQLRQAEIGQKRHLGLHNLAATHIALINNNRPQPHEELRSK